MGKAFTAEGFPDSFTADFAASTHAARFESRGNSISGNVTEG